MTDKSWELIIKCVSKEIESKHELHPNVLHLGIGEIILKSDDDFKVYYVPEDIWMAYHQRNIKP